MEEFGVSASNTTRHPFRNGPDHTNKHAIHLPSPASPPATRIPKRGPTLYSREFISLFFQKRAQSPCSRRASRPSSTLVTPQAFCSGSTPLPPPFCTRRERLGASARQRSCTRARTHSPVVWTLRLPSPPSLTTSRKYNHLISVVVVQSLLLLTTRHPPTPCPLLLILPTHTAPSQLPCPLLLILPPAHRHRHSCPPRRIAPHRRSVLPFWPLRGRLGYFSLSPSLDSWSQ